MAHAEPAPPVKSSASERRPSGFAKRLLRKGLAVVTSMSPRNAQGPVAVWVRRMSYGGVEGTRDLQLSCFWFEGTASDSGGSCRSYF